MLLLILHCEVWTPVTFWTICTSPYCTVRLCSSVYCSLPCCKTNRPPGTKWSWKLKLKVVQCAVCAHCGQLCTTAALPLLPWAFGKKQKAKFKFRPVFQAVGGSREVSWDTGATQSEFYNISAAHRRNSKNDVWWRISAESRVFVIWPLSALIFPSSPLLIISIFFFFLIRALACTVHVHIFLPWPVRILTDKNRLIFCQ